MAGPTSWPTSLQRSRRRRGRSPTMLPASATSSARSTSWTHGPARCSGAVSTAPASSIGIALLHNQGVGDGVAGRVAVPHGGGVRDEVVDTQVAAAGDLEAEGDVARAQVDEVHLHGPGVK